MSDKKTIRVGSRKSELALIQTKYVISLLEQQHPDKVFEIVTMNTLGDNILDIPLPKIGEKSLFTKELESALLSRCVDFVVHSLKDLPTVLPDGMTIGAVLEREDPRDALVLHEKHKTCNLNTLPKGSVIGTSSLRRAAQLSRRYPDLVVESIRGNLNTRLKKLDGLNKFAAIILATAGLNRIGWHERISIILEPEELMYAVGQGALAVECRQNDEDTINLLSSLYEVKTAIQILAERSFLKTLGGGCSAPVAVNSVLNLEKEEKPELSLKGAVWSLDGKVEIIDSMTCNLSFGNLKRCKNCPLNNNLSKTLGIECLAGISRGCSVTEDEVPKKKQKLDEKLISPLKNDDKKLKVEDIPVELLENDPHEHCPIDVPIGSDFMGKCPYLESSPTSAKKLLEDLETQIPSKCPFSSLNKSASVIQNEILASKIVDDFCGLVLPKNIDRKVFEEAELLGAKLAECLMEKGALEVMAKAKASIHS